MIFKRKYVRKHFLKAYKEVIVPGTTDETVMKKERIMPRRLIAVQLSCILLVLSVMTVAVVIYYNKGPANALIPGKTSDVSDNLLKLPKSGVVSFFDTGIRHTQTFFDYPDIDFESMKQLPVYKRKNDVDTEKLLDTFLEYFSIDKEIYEIKATNVKHSIGSGHTLVCFIKKDSELQAIINVTSTGRVMLTIEDVEKSSIDFNYNPPDDVNKEILENYFMNYITENSDIFNINISSTIVDYSFPNHYDGRLYVNVPNSDTEKLLDYNNIGEFVAITRTGNRVLISLRFNEVSELIGYYPIISSTQSKEKYRNNDFICYDSLTKDYLERGKLKLSSEDEIIKIWLTYSADENDYVKPVYEIALSEKSGHIYYVAIDAIDEQYIQ